MNCILNQFLPGRIGQRRRRTLVKTMVVAATLGCCGQGEAAVFWQWTASVSDFINFGFGDQPDTIYLQEAGSAAVTGAGANPTSGQATASAFLTVDHGVLRSRAVATAVGTETGGGGGVAQTQLSFSDRLTITHPSLDGQVGTLHYTVLIDGRFRTETTGQAGDQHQVSEGIAALTILGTAQMHAVSYSSYRGASDTPGLPVFPEGGVIEVSQDFIFGQEFTIGLALDLSVNARARYDAASRSVTELLYGNSAYWGGIGSVTSGGTELEGWSVGSESGVNYVGSFAPVPEPETFAAMGAAGLLLFAWVRRRAG